MEFSWHVMFGAPAFNCPHAGECYCKLYGECGGEEREEEEEKVVVELLGFKDTGKGEMARSDDGKRNGMMKGCDKERCGQRWDWPPGRDVSTPFSFVFYLFLVLNRAGFYFCLEA